MKAATTTGPHPIAADPTVCISIFPEFSQKKKDQRKKPTDCLCRNGEINFGHLESLIYIFKDQQTSSLEQLQTHVDAQPMMEETILVGDDLMLGPPSPVIPPEIADHDKELRQRLQDSEYKLGLSMPLDLAKERATQLESKTTTLERHLILASGIEGADGFRQRWSLHGRLTDTKKMMEALKKGLENRKSEDNDTASIKAPATKRWFFW
ncbi:hypothetical protein CTI12_AA432540 [Artemisia annua]|uniref:DUF7803 domain-containing protein n=1 Tax=Artemisia annua TaxID=35608 RepID=A0A2U1M0G8_ARTAN|nr:hypothetical protein CTI12_AA432540 [Artemisia annua]